MSDPARDVTLAVETYGFPAVTVPRDMIEDCPPTIVERMLAHVRDVERRWLALPQAERDRILTERMEQREAERDEWLREHYALEREIGLEHVTHELDRLCTSTGLDPWDAWRRPRHDERAAKVHAYGEQIRADLAAAGHKPVTTALERALPPIVTDDTMPADTIEIRDHDGNVLTTIRVEP